MEDGQGSPGAKKILLLGTRRDIPRLLPSLELFVLPSVWEGFGVVFAEAMACGLPVVASRIEGIDEVVVDGETGTLVPPRSSALLAQAMLRLLGSPGERARLRRCRRATPNSTPGSSPRAQTLLLE